MFLLSIDTLVLLLLLATTTTFVYVCLLCVWMCGSVCVCMRKGGGGERSRWPTAGSIAGIESARVRSNIPIGLMVSTPSAPKWLLLHTVQLRATLTRPVLSFRFYNENIL